ncbi:imidazoleglycerol-phosphate dehydratase [Candidatus Termititenax persephonae]|uniref:Imidazoleglycerol-phosphate dehydratase n=1 Tax=Candidatus Termititenax persephonae TaxID=2218525 RepID=A0A388TGH5_9BACT|nr:imidazoleglycerol-phosphate dehydratase [Candidatus Termititenax persephonae]
MRKAKKNRETKETNISMELNLDGQGNSAISTGIAFFDHMLTLLAKHGNFDLKISAQGDLDVDAHHTVEDVGLVLGEVFKQALGDKSGITRYGFFILPMDEALAECALDIANRPFLSFRAKFAKAKVGEFDAELVEEFWRAFVAQAGISAHIHLLSGSNLHHQAEAIFKGMARALRMAVRIDPAAPGVPSTKGIL